MKSGMKASLLGLVLLGMVMQLPLTTSRTAYAAQPGQVTTVGNSSIVTPSVASPTQAQARIQTDWGKMPLYFTANQGHLDSNVAFYIQGADKTLYFTQEGVTFALTERLVDSAPRGAEESPRNRWIVKLDFVGANPVRPAGEAQTDAIISYFKGPPDEWHTGSPTYSKIIYPNLWNGIDLAYSGTVNRLKYEFVVRPGADPSHIQLAYRGATVSVNGTGQLQVVTPEGGFQDDAPTAYQEVDGVRVPVQVSFSMNDGGLSTAEGSAMEGPHPYGFHLGEYDPTLPLVIDPAVLVYAGYIGGSGIDTGTAIAVDAAGNAFITGNTYSTQATFPVTAGPDLTFNGGNSDVFVVKVKADGTGLVYAGYIGGNGFDSGSGIAVDAAGNAYITGFTLSSEATLPVTVGPDVTYNGSDDAFVAKVNVDGTALVYAGYIGGSGSERGNGIAIDSAGNAYVTGHTNSTQATFPATVGPDLTFSGGTYDAFVAKVNATGTGFVYTGYIGGSGNDQGYGIVVDAAGNAYITGSTTSTETSFPVMVGPDLTFHGGTYGAPDDAFVAKVKSDGSGLVYAGYIGGSGNEGGNAIAVDAAGNSYITGHTTSSETTLPVNVGPDLTFNGGNGDAFVAQVRADGAALVNAGYIGGSAQEVGNGIALDAAGNAYVVGYTWSTEATFPVTVGPDLTHNGGNYDVFVAKVSSYHSRFASASKRVNKTLVSVGDTLSYTVAFTMSNDMPVGSVFVTDTLPSQLTYIPNSLSASSGSYSHNAGVITWNGTVNANTPVSITFGATVSSFALYVVNTAIIDAGERVTPSATVEVKGGGICNLVKRSEALHGFSGSWDGSGVWDPTVLKEGGTYKMWYTGRDAGSNWRVGYATSLDGITWTKYAGNPVLSPSATWEGTRVSYPTVINDGGTYKMWYSGQDSAGVMRIGYATSSDGIAWAKYASNAVLNVGSTGSWDGAAVRYPSVVKVGGTFHLWYGGSDGVTSRIGHATSTNGINWTRDPANPVLSNGTPGAWDWITVYAPNVVLWNGTFVMWYSGGTVPAAWQTGYATSPDGTTWTRQSLLISEGDPGTVDSDSADYASAIRDGTGFKIWYSGYVQPTYGEGTYRIVYATVDICGSTPPSAPLPGTTSTFLPLISKSQTASCSAYYTDDFSDSHSGWPTASDNIGQVAYVGGEYQIQFFSPYYWTAQTPGAAGTDYAVTARARRVSGSGDYGIIFGITPGWSQFYAFLIDPPWYTIRRYNNGTWTALAPWSTSGYVAGGSNALKVVRNGTWISAYANNQLLATVNEGTISGWTRIGLIARSGSNHQDARFDDFAMYPAFCGAGALARSAASRMDMPEKRGGALPLSEFKR